VAAARTAEDAMRKGLKGRTVTDLVKEQEPCKETHATQSPEARPTKIL
jgi:hypothetical protein